MVQRIHWSVLCQVLTEVLERLKLDTSLCIGNATDGASNMQGQYRGFSALLASQSPNHVHVWCYAHVLNLVLSDTTQIVIESGSLFDLLNDTAVFIRESYQRVNIWGRRAMTSDTDALLQLERHVCGLSMML